MIGLLALVVLAQQAAVAPAEVVPRVAMEVLNAAAGRSILHLEDVVGPAARTLGAHEPARAVLVFATAIEDCADCGTHIANLSRLHDRFTKKGGLVIALVLARPEAMDVARRQFAWSELRFPIAADPHRLVRERLGLLRPGSAVVIRSDGTIVSEFARGDRPLKDLVRAFSKELEDRP